MPFTVSEGYAKSICSQEKKMEILVPDKSPRDSIKTGPLQPVCLGSQSEHVSPLGTIGCVLGACLAGHALATGDSQNAH